MQLNFKLTRNLRTCCDSEPPFVAGHVGSKRVGSVCEGAAAETIEEKPTDSSILYLLTTDRIPSLKMVDTHLMADPAWLGTRRSMAPTCSRTA